MQAHRRKKVSQFPWLFLNSEDYPGLQGNHSATTSLRLFIRWITMNAWMFLEPFDISRFLTMRTHRSRYRESPSAVLPSASWSYLQFLWRRGSSVGQNIVHANVTFSATLTCHYTRQPQIIKCDFSSSRVRHVLYIALQSRWWIWYPWSFARSRLLRLVASFLQSTREKEWLPQQISYVR